MLEFGGSGRSFLTLESSPRLGLDFRIHRDLRTILATSPADYFERADKVFVNDHHGTVVHKFPAIVWSGKHRDKLPLGKELIPVLDYLMGSAYQVEFVSPVELGHNVLAKSVRHSPLVVFPAAGVLIWIRPKEIAKKA